VRLAPDAPLAVAASRVRIEERRILEALERRRVPYQYVDTRQVWMELAPARTPPYAVALNREISHTRSLYWARLLEATAVPSVNTAAAIAVCGDKLLTSLALQRAGVPTPRTALALTTEAAFEAVEQLGFPLVVKPLVGSRGRLAARLRDRDEAQAVLEHRQALPSPQQHVVYLQELVGEPGRDIRVIVVGGEVLGATYRRADGWRANVARGARSAPCPLHADLTRLALAAAAAVGGDVVGVDLLESGTGELCVLEVNHAVEFQGFQQAHGDRVDVADAIVGYTLARAGE
jgi:[lysine-biosynthesis-protein LysW]--L-2-aminoadipate ligase